MTHRDPPPSHVLDRLSLAREYIRLIDGKHVDRSAMQDMRVRVYQILTLLELEGYELPEDLAEWLDALRARDPTRYPWPAGWGEGPEDALEALAEHCQYLAARPDGAGLERGGRGADLLDSVPDDVLGPVPRWLTYAGLGVMALWMIAKILE